MVEVLQQLSVPSVLFGQFNVQFVPFFAGLVGCDFCLNQLLVELLL